MAFIPFNLPWRTATHPVAGKLLRSLLAAIDAPEMQAFGRLCQHNSNQIILAFPAWLTPPKSIAPGSPEYHKYLNGMYLISKLFADCLGAGGLFAQLVAAKPGCC